ncbi:FtsX-like permease family protein [Nonomuraea gerenzanensis]|uniref:Putative ABC transport system integral membrane protein n=1 Tax=Nonomuraea gerenzanensis TaxID=93944 RepID=A0A1M4EQF6_9ACTN|nr:ABC transporter permease [Nonomuraea gerenzanensis]UBU12492.1 ABC transporter permease [Nonomuraea gerenzanensis]SBP01047.1 putative ABC transport system integral membrane protein [Nonomuraea gerenzanensis]
MLKLALRSFAHHRAAAIATGLVALVGTILVTGMMSLLGTGLAASTAAADRAFLVQFPLIMGGWTVAIVLFAMVSTVGVALGGRAGEIAGLRLIGATPRQVQGMLVVETTAITAVTALPGLAGGYLLGWVISRSMHAAGLTGAASVFAPGAALPLLGVLVVLAASVLAAWIGSRSLARRSPVADAAPPSRSRTGRRPGLGRRVAATLMICAGLASSATVLGMDPADVLTTAMTGPACVLVAVGLCLLAPELVLAANRALAVLRPAHRAAPLHLAALNLSAAPDRVRPTVTFLTLFVGVAAGTLSMQGVENAAGTGGSTGEVLASINYFVVALIAAFMAIALTNNLVASITRRRAEFAVMSLVGSTGGQTHGMLVREIGVATAVSTVAGSVGAFVTVLPFAVVKTGDPLQAAAPLPYAITIAIGAGVTLGVSALVGRRVIRTA